jgi:hypothetical protein
MSLIYHVRDTAVPPVALKAPKVSATLVGQRG